MHFANSIDICNVCAQGVFGIPDPFFHYDISDASTITLDTTRIDGIDDKSGNGFDLSNVGSKVELLAAEQNGLDTGDWGLGTHLSAADPPGGPSTEMTFFAVAKPTTAQQGAMISKFRYQGGQASWIMGFDGSGQFQTWICGTGSALSGRKIRTLTSPAADLTNYRLYAMRFQAGEIDHVSQDLVSTTVVSNADAVVTTIFESTTNFVAGSFTYPFSPWTRVFKGEIGEMIMYAGALTDDQLAEKGAELMTKWGL